MTTPGTGSLLIAEPFLKDPSFTRTVILVCRHEATEGTFGFVVNRLFPQTLGELIPELENFHLPVFNGGPVQMDTLHYLHQYPKLLPDSQEVGEGIFWGGDFETLKTLLRNNTIEPGKVKFFLGYSGWEKGQLDAELDQKSWLSASCTRKLVFDTPQEDIWQNSLLHLGGHYAMMRNFPTDPQLN